MFAAPRDDLRIERQVSDSIPLADGLREGNSRGPEIALLHLATQAAAPQPGTLPPQSAEG